MPILVALSVLFSLIATVLVVYWMYTIQLHTAIIIGELRELRLELRARSR